MTKNLNYTSAKGSEITSVSQLGLYYDVLLDGWFKRAFQDGKDSKRLLTLFLRELIPERDIRDITYAPQEMTNPFDKGKSVRVDVTCTDAAGDRFVVEMQRASQANLYERALFSSTFAIQRQLREGDSYDLKPMYFIGLLRFDMHHGVPGFLRRFSLRESTSGEQLTDKLNYIFMELPKCRIDEKCSELEKFGYALYHLSEFEEKPEGLDGEIFKVLFNSTEIIKLPAEDKYRLINDMNSERDTRNQIAFAREEGREEGLQAGKAERSGEIARKLLAKGMDAKTVAEVTGLSVDDILLINAE